ncbi:alkyl hydroperoxide reductase subunit F [Lactococcus formosensis]|uniref:alkyl hydroperoxide reductase subunit F n=1 Tax=Lactococcus formosensis TaxID=1281486 RepID=UPI001BCDC37D|nr:alkyl hydroperoxide reductase subunit F [Lactococcus formosensis]
MLEENLKAQLKQYLELLENDIALRVKADPEDVNGKKVREFVNEIAEMSPRISVEEAKLVKAPGFSVVRKGEMRGIAFAGIPLGHEFNSLVLALLQVSGRAPKIEDDLKKRIQAIDKPYHFETYVSLTCHNCPDVVQALNIMSVLNENITHTMIEGGMFQDEVKSRGVMAVPTVFANGEEFSSGRMSLEEILNKLVGQAGSEEFDDKDSYDVLVVGGGPAGASAAIYAARKGIRTGILAEKFGGQPLETLGIENLIGTPYTEGPKLATQLEEHVKAYPADIMKTQKAVKLEKKDLLEVTLENGAVLQSKTIVLSTGARWRSLGIPGEEEFKNKGIAYCPHCDGPIFAGQKIAVVGGGNSGIEAAIDLAGVVEHVTVLEFLPELKADKVLQEKLYSLGNVTVLTNVETKAIHGTDKVESLDYVERDTQKEVNLELSGVFILIGLVPNTEWLEGVVERNSRGEIVVDKQGATDVPGVFAAGDCTDSAYKQIVIAMGSGATASLGAFDYLIRH